MEVISKPTLAEIKDRVATLPKPTNTNPPGHLFNDVHELMAIIGGLQNDVKNKDKHIQELGRQAKTQNRQLTETIKAIQGSSLVDYYWKNELTQQISKAMKNDRTKTGGESA